MNAAASSSLYSVPPPAFAVALTAPALLTYLIYVGVIVLVTVIVTLWITTLRQPPLKDTRRSHRRHRSSRSGIWAWLGGGSDSESADGKKGRRRRRSHRRRNPTLAETGGLPPVRNEPPSSAENPQH
jgi:hypothetical protein